MNRVGATNLWRGSVVVHADREKRDAAGGDCVEMWCRTQVRILLALRADPDMAVVWLFPCCTWLSFAVLLCLAACQRCVRVFCSLQRGVSDGQGVIGDRKPDKRMCGF